MIKPKNSQLKKMFGALLFALSLFLGVPANLLAAEEAQSNCNCYDKTDIATRQKIKTMMVLGMDSVSEGNCHQMCANEKANGANFYAFRDNGKLTEITKTPGSVVAEAAPNTCSCDSGGLIGEKLVDRKRVNTEEGCIEVCRATAGATRMRFNENLGGGGAWTAIPAAIATEKKTEKLEYTLLESFPGFFAAKEKMTDLPAMILAIYKFGIWTVGIAGLFMLIVGGVMYLGSAGNTSIAGSAKGIITDALIGIVGALGAYLFLYVINPDLIKMNLSFSPAAIGETAAQVQAPSGTLSDADARSLLKQNGIDVAASSGNCTDINKSSCTSLQGIPERTIDKLIKLKQGCYSANSKCKVIITGGTETGHISHGVGKPRLDVRTDDGLKKYLLELKQKNFLGNNGISEICTTEENKALRYKCDYQEAAEHIHLSFSS